MFRWSLPFVLLAALGIGCEDSSVEAASATSDLTYDGVGGDTTLREVDALGYEVDITVSDVPGSESFVAVVKGTYAATEPLAALTLDFDGNAIDDVTVDGVPAQFTRDEGHLVVVLPKPVAKLARFSTRVAYHGTIGTADGADPNDFASYGGLMVKQRNAEGKRIYTSLNWPSKARRWLPLRDHPRDAAQVAFRATFPKSFTVLANGRRTATAEHPDGSKTWSYEATTPMPAYDFHLTAYDGWKVHESRSASNVPIASYTYAKHDAKQSTIYGDLSAALGVYERSFGPYRWGSASFIEEPIFGGGMEHASVVSMDETLFVDPAEARAVALHELAHHWSGNLVHLRQWNDLWLSEGFADYLTLHAITRLDGAEAGKARWRQYLARALVNDRYQPHPLAPAGDEIDVLSIFDDTTYKKGAWVLRMLEHVVGEAKMAAFLRSWFERHGGGAAVGTDDLLRELSAASGRDLAPIFEGFVRNAYHPELKVTFSTNGADTDVTIDQVQTDGPAAGFRLPLDLEVHDAAGTAKRLTVELSGRTTTTRIASFAATAIVSDPDEYAFATTVCTKTCRDGYACAVQRGNVSACIPH